MSRRLDPRLAAAIAVALVGGALAAILLFGGLSYPDFPSLLEDPDRTVRGTVAYLRWNETEDDQEPCLWSVPASGMRAARRLRCGHAVGGPIDWSGEHVVVSEHTSSGDRRLWLDPETGDVVREEAGEVGPVHVEPMSPGAGQFSHRPAPPAPELLTRSNGGVVDLRLREDGDERLVASASGPRDYHWWSALWSPDRRYVLVTDSAQRLLVVRVEDGLVRLLVEDGGEGVWGPGIASRESAADG